MTTGATNDSLLGRAIRAARLERQLYSEVAADPRTMPQAFFIVIGAAMLSGVAGLSAGLGFVVLSIVFAPLAWVLTSVLAQLIGTRIIGATGSASWEQVARALGFANAPLFLGILAVIPPLLGPVALLLVVWRIAAMIVALSASMAVSTGQAAMIVLLTALTLGVGFFLVDAAVNGFPAG